MCGLYVIFLMLILMFAPLASQETTTIQSNEVGVRFDLISGELEDPLLPGSYQYNSTTEEITVYRIDQQELLITEDDDFLGRTQDNHIVQITGNITYRIDPEKVNMIHARWRNTYPSNFIHPTLRGVVREVISNSDLARTQTAPTDIEMEISLHLEARLAEEGFILDDLSINSITPAN